MSDWLLIGLFVALVLLLLLTIFGFAVYSGLFTEVIVNAGLPPIGNITVAYKFQVGPYGDSGRFFTESCSVSPRLSSIAIYYDNPHTVGHSSELLIGLSDLNSSPRLVVYKILEDNYVSLWW